jgi:hypothetical protein
MRHARESDQRQNSKANRAKRAGPHNKQRCANFVIRRGCTYIRPFSALRSSFNAEKLKYRRPYELRMAVRTKATNYEKGVK